MEYLKYGLLLHLIAACFMLTNSLAFETKDKTGGMGTLVNVKENIDNIGADGTQMENTLMYRFKYYHQQLYFVMLIVLILTYFLGYSFYSMLYYIGLLIYKSVMGCIRKFYAYTKK